MSIDSRFGQKKAIKSLAMVLILFTVFFSVLSGHFLFPSRAAITALVGDLNNDGIVNIYDLSILLGHWAQTGTALTEDLNHDGVVNIYDLSILLSNYGKTATAGPTLSLNSNTNTVSWSAVARATGYQGSISNGPRSDPARTTTYVSLGNVMTWSPPNQCGHTLYYGVNDNADGQWSANEITIAWPACPSSSPIIVGMNGVAGYGASINGPQPSNCNGVKPCYISTLLKNIGVTWARLDIGRGDLSLVDLTTTHTPGFHLLPLYENGGNGDSNCLAGTASQITSDFATLLPAMQARGLHVLEMCNESYLSMCAEQYSPLYDAAHKAIASYKSAHNYSVTLLAVAGTDWYQSNGWNGSSVFSKGCAHPGWYQGIAASLPGGAAEVDGFTLHPYPHNPAPDGSNINGGGANSDGTWWGMITPMHSEAVTAGFSPTLPWWLTEAGICAIAGGNCPDPVNSYTVQGSYYQFILNDITRHYPWVAAFFWYSSTDDSSGHWGVLNVDNSNPFAISERPGFTALKAWMSANTDKVKE